MDKNEVMALLLLRGHAAEANRTHPTPAVADVLTKIDEALTAATSGVPAVNIVSPFGRN